MNTWAFSTILGACACPGSGPDPGGGKSGHGPPSKLAMEFGPPFGTERAMVVLWFYWKVRNVAPRIDVGYGPGPPLWKKTILKHEKGRWLKKSSQKILGDRWNFWGEMQTFIRETPKKGREGGEAGKNSRAPSSHGGLAQCRISPWRTPIGFELQTKVDKNKFLFISMLSV